MEEIKLFSEGPVNTELINKSWEASFQKAFPKGYWDWRFRNNPFEKEIKACYVISEGLLAAYYSVSPLIINLPSGKKAKAGLMNMGFTHPDFQGRGYYVKINQLLHERLKEEGYACCFGFANHNSHYPYRRYIGWNDLSVLNIFNRSYLKLHDLKSKIPDLKIEIRSMDLKGIEIASNLSVCSEDLIYTPRIFEFLKWRILDNPKNVYEYCKISLSGKIIALIIFKVYQNTSVDIMEFFYNREIEKDKNNILLESLNYIQNLKRNDINLWSNLFTEEHIVLEKHGFKESNFSTYFGIMNFTAESQFLDYKNWHYRFIDSDVY